jgi:hypothetical protein
MYYFPVALLNTITAPIPTPIKKAKTIKRITAGIVRVNI